jgi:hypothetical protein
MMNMDQIIQDAADNIRKAIELKGTIEKRIALLEKAGVSTGTAKSELSGINQKIANWRKALESEGVVI